MAVDTADRLLTIYSLKNSRGPDPANELRFLYRPGEPGAEVVFPTGCRPLSPDQLAELGVLMIALAGKARTDNTRELLTGFRLPDPGLFTGASDKARHIASNLVDVFANTFAGMDFYAGDARLRTELEQALTDKLVELLTEEAS